MAKKKAAPKENPVVATAPNETPEMKPNEVLTPEKDQAVQNAKVEGDPKIFQIEPQKEDKKSKEIVKEDAELKEDLHKGETVVGSSNAPADLSVLAKPMVPNPVGGKPVYETSLQARLAQSAKGELGTPDKK